MLLAELGHYLADAQLDHVLAAPVSALVKAGLSEHPDRAVLLAALSVDGASTVRELCEQAMDDLLLRRFGRARAERFARAVQNAVVALEDRSVGGAADQEDDDLDLLSALELSLVAGERNDPARIPPPPRAPEPLRAWARAHGVLERLADVAPAAGMPDQLTPALSIEELLTQAAPRPTRGGRFDPRDYVLRMRQDAAVTLLHRLAENLAHLARRRQREAESARPVDPVFAPLARAIERARAALPAAPARPPGDVIPAPLAFREAPPRLVYDEASGVRDALLLGYRTPELVTISLARWERGELGCSCRCRTAAPGGSCAHLHAALAEASALLAQPGAPAYGPLRAFVATPAWTRALERLERSLAELPAPGSADERISWRIGGNDGEVRLDALLHKRTANGGWSRGAVIGIEALRRRPELLAAAADARAAELLPTASHDDRRRGLVYRALEALAGASNVFLAERKDAAVLLRPVSVRLRLGRITPDEGDPGLVPQIVVGDQVLSPADLLARAPDGRHFVDPDPARNECRLALLPPELEVAARAFAIEEAAFPDGALAEILPRLERLERTVGVELPPDLQGERVEADGRLVCRLTPVGDAGLRLELRVRPLPEGSLLLPGEGPRVVLGRRGDARVHAERRLEREAAAMAALVATLAVDDAAVGPAQFDLSDPDRALELFVAMRERAEGLVVEWPSDAWRVDPVGRAALRLKVTERRDWFGLEGGVEVDGQTVPIAALLAAVRAGRRYVMLGPRRFALIEDELRRRLSAVQDVVFEGRAGLELGSPAAGALADLVEDEDQLEAIPSFLELRQRLVRAATLEPAVPADLRASLRPYQREGFRWLARLAEAGAGACLADDMGLGKTVQVLAVLLARAARGPALVVAPTSVVANWLAEAERFAPSLRRILYRGPDRAGALTGLGPGDLVVTSYAIAVMDAEALGAVRFAALVLDEAQAIKNAATGRARAIRKLAADWRLAVTGTPIENHLGELWSLYRAVSPALFGSWEQFRERFALPIERGGDPGRRAALAEVLRPFLLRRTKEAVAPELPPKTEIVRFVELSPGERRLYEATRVAALASLESERAAAEAQERIQVLAALTRLRQLACHPRLGDEASALPSSKLAALVELVREVREAGHRALVFSQFTRFLDLARPALEAEGCRTLHLDGGTEAGARAARVAAFQRGEADVFLISLRAGGTGLNLTAADYVIHLDPWWNPAVEDQATDRTHRIGQARAITVVRLCARGTVEEMVLDLHRDKRSLATSVLDGADAAARLDTAALIALLQKSAPDARDDEAAARLEAEEREEDARDEVVVGEEPGCVPGAAPEAGPEDGGAAPVVDLVTLDALIELALAPYLPRPPEPSSGTHRSYLRSLQGFREFVARGGATEAPLASHIDRYLGALASGAWPAPKSAYGVARITLGHLRRVAEAGALPPPR